ncbi:MAG TPA: 2'-5' RNA ligase family protein [Pseudonocardiaceae bacterium]|jgi:hypothetical protein|nr:2'-5' RNA ligase family protein [Pseudonocardiaceae bacterium]
MPKAGWTALVAPVPALDPLLARVEAARPGATRPGIPAHVTFLYPFLPMTELDATVTDWLAALAARHAPLSLQFTEVHVEPGFVYLASPLLESLTDEIRAHWPNLVPYLGQFGPNPVAHLSLAIGITDTSPIADLAATALPTTGRLEKLWLVGHDDGQWLSLGEFPLTGKATNA